MNAYLCACMHVLVCMCACVHVCLCACVLVCMAHLRETAAAAGPPGKLRVAHANTALVARLPLAGRARPCIGGPQHVHTRHAPGFVSKPRLAHDAAFDSGLVASVGHQHHEDRCATVTGRTRRWTAGSRGSDVAMGRRTAVASGCVAWGLVHSSAVRGRRRRSLGRRQKALEDRRLARPAAAACQRGLTRVARRYVFSLLVAPGAARRGRGRVAKLCEHVRGAVAGARPPARQGRGRGPGRQVDGGKANYGAHDRGGHPPCTGAADTARPPGVRMHLHALGIRKRDHCFSCLSTLALTFCTHGGGRWLAAAVADVIM